MLQPATSRFVSRRFMERVGQTDTIVQSTFPNSPGEIGDDESKLSFFLHAIAFDELIIGLPVLFICGACEVTYKDSSRCEVGQ